MLLQRQFTDLSKTAKISSLSFVEYILYAFKNSYKFTIRTNTFLAKNHGSKSCSLKNKYIQLACYENDYTAVDYTRVAC